MSAHTKTKQWDNDREYHFVCSGCVNSLGFNVMWDRAEQVGHVIPSNSELDELILEAFVSVPNMMGGLRAVYALGRAAGGTE